MNVPEIMTSMETLNVNELDKIKNYAEGLINKHWSKRDAYHYNPCNVNVGDKTMIGDNRDGKFEIKIIKIRRKTVLGEVVSRVSYGTRPSMNRMKIGDQIKVPFSLLKVGN